jgi:hemolysin D
VTQATATTDYRSILERTLGRLPESTQQARETVYRRARVSLVASLRDLQPPVSEDHIREETARLEDVIRQVESQFQPTPALEPRGETESNSVRLEPGRALSESHGAVALVGRGLGRVRGVVSRQFEMPDPTLPAILEFQRPSTTIVNAPMPRSARGVIWVVSSMVIAMIAVCGLISVDQVVTARGIVVSRSPTILVQPLETAIVRSIDVTEGEQVRAGQIMARLDPTFTSADVGALAAQVSSLSAEVGRLQAEASGKPFVYAGDEPDWLLQASIYGHRKAEFELKVENYRHKIDELNSAISKAESDIVGYTKRAEVAENVEGIRKELEARQLGSRLNTLAAADARVEMQRSRENAEQELQSAKRDKEALQAESDSFVQGWSADVSQKLSESTRKLSDAREGLTKANLRRTLVELRADQDGTVQSLAKVSVGSVLQSGQPFITLVPAAAALEVEANVPGSENGFVHVGDPVAIKFDTFPFSQYGMAQGLVRTVSPTSFTAQEEARNPTSSAPVSSTSEPFYRARVSLDRVALHGTPADFRVTPGMPVTADIKVGRRTVLNYFLGRVLPVAEEGLREPQN